MNSEFINSTYEYFNNQDSKYDKYLNNIVSFKEIKSSNDTIESIIELYDKNEKIKIKASYQYLGEYYIDEHIWKWGWAKDMSKNNNYFIKKIFDYGFNLDTNKGQSKIASLIKSIITNSLIKIKNVDFLLALSMKLTKADFYYKQYHPEKKMDYYYLLRDVKII
jgi:hypothetical protein